MTYDEFMALDEQQQRAAFIEPEKFNDMEIEKNSFAAENEGLKKEMQQLRDSEKKTKEMNYILARKLDTGSRKRDPEEVLNEMFK